VHTLNDEQKKRLMEEGRARVENGELADWEANGSA
jgi:hypothetical protein